MSTRWLVVLCTALTPLLLIPSSAVPAQPGPPHAVPAGASAETRAPQSAGTGPTGQQSLPADPASSPFPWGSPDHADPAPTPTNSFHQFEAEPGPAGLPVWPGVWRDGRRTTLSDGKGVNVQILHIDPGAGIAMLPTMAGGNVHGTATVSAQSGDPFTGGVAGINGGFWLSKPYGEPNGLFIWDGRLVSDAETQGVGPRAAVGWNDDGLLLIDRVDSVETLTLPDGTSLRVNGVNRHHRDEGEQFFDGRDALLGYTTDFGGQALLREPVPLPTPEPTPTPTPTTGPDENPNPPPIPDPDPTPTPTPTPTEPPEPVDLAALRLAAPLWPPHGSVAATVIGITRDKPAAFEVGGGEVILTATGDQATALDGIAVGDELTITTDLLTGDPARDALWDQTTQGMAAGPHLVADGRMVDPSAWESEGFHPISHSGVRAPRSAIGRTADGRVLMVTADGRRPGITAGFTMAELARYMISLGAIEAMSLDGGGSSQIVQDGLLRNVPCCDSSIRRVASSIQLRHDHTFTRSSRLAGDGRIDTANAVADAAHPSGAANAVLASAGSFPDALAGGPLASAVGGPLLLSNRTRLTSSTAAALQRLGTSRVWLLGGEAVLEPQVVTDLQALGISVARLSGETRIETAVEIASEISRIRGGADRAFVVPAGTFTDALLAGAPGGMLGIPILLTHTRELHPASEEWLRGVDEVLVLDSDDQLLPAVGQRLSLRGRRMTSLGGDGRYASSAAVATWLASQVPDSGSQVIVARGADFPDALAGGPLAAALGVPLMLIPGETVHGHDDALDWFSQAGQAGQMDHVTILGGVAAVSTYAQWQLESFSE